MTGRQSMSVVGVVLAVIGTAIAFGMGTPIALGAGGASLTLIAWIDASGAGS